MQDIVSIEGTEAIVRKPKNWDQSRAYILAHGAGKGIDSPFMNFFHQGIANEGCLSVIFNFQYMQEGRRAPDSQKKLQNTYRAVIDRVVNTYDPEKLIIGGKSMGGRVASYVAKDTPGIFGLTFLGYPLHPPGQHSNLRDEHLYDLDLGMVFVSGTRDPFAKKELLDRVTSKIGSRARLVWIEGGDHSLKVNKSDNNSWGMALKSIQAWP